jgi:hypothetical protein
MKRHTAIAFATLALCGPCVAAEQQNTAVIQAGQLFDGKSDRLLSDQVIVIRGDQIVEVGTAGSIKVPAGAEEISADGVREGHLHDVRPHHNQDPGQETEFPYG